ncbi:hypothetical protein VKT23_004625 [Stygiomarasmius scandens]|uniref:DUF6532 domain-containing protein n=1 Tax=Marasmiellus scandens TaxID=2682957 RepID=A0ABR1JX68_9AGAR
MQDPIKRHGVYRNPLISKVVEAILELMTSVDYEEELANGIPLPVISFAILTIEQALEEWQTGKFVQKRICTTGYHSLRFSQHLRTLQALDVRAQKNLRERLLVEARYDVLLLTERDLIYAAEEAEDEEYNENEESEVLEGDDEYGGNDKDENGDSEDDQDDDDGFHTPSL